MDHFPNGRNRKRLLWTTFILGLAMIPVAARYGLPWLVSTYPSEAVREQIAQGILSGTIKANAKGAADLPPSLRYGFRKNAVYVTRRQNLTLIYLPTMDARFGTAGLIYCSRPLRAEDQTEERGIRCVQVTTPYTPAFGRQTVARPLTRRLSDHWYYSELISPNS